MSTARPACIVEQLTCRHSAPVGLDGVSVDNRNQHSIRLSRRIFNIGTFTSGHFPPNIPIRTFFRDFTLPVNMYEGEISWWVNIRVSLIMSQEGYYTGCVGNETAVVLSELRNKSSYFIKFRSIPTKIMLKIRLSGFGFCRPEPYVDIFVSFGFCSHDIMHRIVWHYIHDKRLSKNCIYSACETRKICRVLLPVDNQNHHWTESSLWIFC